MLPLLEHVRRGQAAGGDGLGRAVALAHLNGGLLWSYRNLSNFFFSSTDSESPPENTPLRQLRFAPCPCWADATALRTASGTPAMKLQRVLGDELGIALRGEARDKDAAPALREHRSECTRRDRSRGTAASRQSILSPGRNIGFVAIICWPSALKLRLVSRMPLVVPVVPPE